MINSLFFVLRTYCKVYTEELRKVTVTLKMHDLKTTDTRCRVGLYKYKVKAVCIELSINMQDTPTTDSRIRSRM